MTRLVDAKFAPQFRAIISVYVQVFLLIDRNSLQRIAHIENGLVF